MSGGWRPGRGWGPGRGWVALWSPRTAVLVDGWYSWVAPGDGPHAWTAFSTALDVLPAPVRARILARGVLRGLVLALLSGRYAAVAVIRYDPGWRSLLLARAIFGRRRKLVVFQFFDHPPASGLRAALWRRIDRWALRRALAVAQVLTQAERDAYPQRFAIPSTRFRLIRFPARISAPGSVAPPPRDAGPVLAAGRAHCDWETLFAAARPDWDLQVVCSAEDRERVERLDALHRVGARIGVELPQDAAYALLRAAAISVICVTEGLVGRGHIRLAEATDAGAAVVAANVTSLHGYLEDGTGAVLVPPQDPPALRAAVDGLLHDNDMRARLAARAFAAAEAWTAPDYLRALQALAAEVAAPDGSGPGRVTPPGTGHAPPGTRHADAEAGSDAAADADLPN